MEHISELAVLVVDDQPIINEFYRKILEQLGCKWIYSALSGEEAAKVLTCRGDINLVLTDIDMHPGNGLELLQAIRCGDIPNTPRDLCIMVVTDYNYRHNVMKAVGLDCHGFLSKPLNATILSDKIKAALHRRINLASVETYRGIPTNLRLTPATSPPSSLPTFVVPPSQAESHAPEHQDQSVTRSESAVAQPATPEPAAEPGNEASALEAAIEELLPTGIRDSFLIHKQEAIREILRLLSRVGKAFNGSREDELTDMIDQLEQMSTDLFQQEYLHQREHGYQSLSAHQAEHGLILQRTQMLAGKLQGRHPERAIKAHQQLREAWYRHISSKDLQYIQFLLNQVSRG